MAKVTVVAIFGVGFLVFTGIVFIVASRRSSPFLCGLFSFAAALCFGSVLALTLPVWMPYRFSGLISFLVGVIIFLYLRRECPEKAKRKLKPKRKNDEMM